MTGWNMPPGVNESDIPGNRPEDTSWEKVLDEFYGLHKKHSSLPDNPAIQELIEDAIQYGINLANKDCTQMVTDERRLMSEDIWDALDTFENKLEHYLEERSNQ